MVNLLLNSDLIFFSFWVITQNKQPVLVTIYRSYVLSHITYSAPVLTSAGCAIHDEMERFQARSLRILGLTAEEAATKYNISSVNKLLNNTCANTLLKILSDPQHPITAKLPVNIRSESLTRKYLTSKAKTEQYSNSFVQKYLRYLRDGTTNLYQDRILKDYNTTSIKQKRNITINSNSDIKVLSLKVKVPCLFCNNKYLSLKAHLNKNKICNMIKEAPNRTNSVNSYIK